MHSFRSCLGIDMDTGIVCDAICVMNHSLLQRKNQKGSACFHAEQSRCVCLCAVAVAVVCEIAITQSYKCGKKTITIRARMHGHGIGIICSLFFFMYPILDLCRHLLLA